MKASFDGFGRSVSSESTQANENNQSQLALEFSKLEEFVMRGTGRSNNNYQTGEDRNSTHADARQTASLGLETMTAAALLWGRGPMTTAPMATSSSSSSSSSLSSSMGTDHKPNSNSPASNAAAALLVGMSMRVEREAKNKLPETEAKANQPTVLATAASTVSNSPGQTDAALDVEARWREIRLEISKQTLVETQTQTQLTRGDSGDQEEGLELPKGVTRRPSGAWQAQIYFAGKTRYIGVWEKPQQAATAYNLAKEALKELKAKQRNNRKRRYQYPGNIDTTVGTSNSSSPGSRDATMFTPRKESESQSQSPHMPPSISWPSSASSSSTVSSADFRSPSHGRGPFKKRRGNDMGADGNANEPSVHPPQQASEPGPLPPPRGHPFSAFSQQHLQQQQQQQQQQQMLPNGNPHALTHPALQLLSLRPPPQAQHPQWMHPPPAQFHQPQQQQHFHNPLHSLHQFPYPQPTMGSNNNGTNQNHPPMMAQGSANQNSKVAKKFAKNNKLSKLPSKKSKPSSKTAGSNSPSAAKDKAERDAQNLKWKTIRAEVLAIFDESRRKRVFEGGKEDPRKKTFDKDVLRGITVRPSGKFQAQLYFGGRSRYIGVFDSEYEAASAYEMIRSKLKNEPAKGNSERQISSSSTASTASMTSTSTLASVQDSKEEAGKDSKESTTSASSTSTTMRSITPSPTPRNDGKGEATKILC